MDVPAGIADGQRIRLAATAPPGEAGALPGDLYVLVRVREDERFVRDGDDLVTALDVPAPIAALGRDARGAHARGQRPRRAPPGTQPGEVLMLRGEGMPALGRGRRGNLRVVVNVVIPRRLNEEQRELLERLNDSLGEENLRSPESVFAKLRRALRQPGRVIRLARTACSSRAGRAGAPPSCSSWPRPASRRSMLGEQTRSSTPSTARPASCPRFPS